MLQKTLATITVFGSAIAALAAGFDGKNLTTNDWFDANFTSLTANDTPIASGDTTGLAGGSWTAVPATGTAKIAADGEATLLALDAPGEELVFSPTNLAAVSGMETSSFKIKSDAIDALPEIAGDAQAAFTIFDDGTTVSAMGYVAGGWTNLVYAADALTNAWFTLYIDFATVSSVRYVRFSVKPDSGSRAVLADINGTTWFQAASNATTVASVSFSGVGSCRGFTGDSLEEVVATYNGVGYGSVADAIAAAAEDGTVTLVKAVTGENIAVSENVTLALGTYNLTASSFTVASGKTLTVTGTGTISAPTITGGGSLVFSNAATLTLTGSSASSIASLTADAAIALWSNGPIDISEITANEDFTFAGRIANASTLTKKGAGTVTLVSVTAPAGGIVIEAGDIIIDNTLSGISPYVILDASAESTITETDGKVTAWSSTVNDHSFTNEASAMTYVAAEGVFGGKKTVRTNNSQLQSDFVGANASLSVFAALHYYANSGTGAYLFHRTGANNVYIGKRNAGNNYWSALRASSTPIPLWQNSGAVNENFRVQDTVLSVEGMSNGGAANNHVGGGNGDIAIAELITLSSDPSMANRKRIEAYLGTKWEISGMTTLPVSIPLTLAGGTSLDLSGLSRTFDAIALTGTGTAEVSGGALTITDPISVAVRQTLVIPYGSIYTCATGTGAMVDETAGTVTFKHNAAEIAVTDPETSAVTTTIYDTVAGAISAYTEGTLTIHDSATLDLGTTDVNIRSVVLDDGVELTLTQNAPWVATFSADTLVNTRAASTYVWTPGENSTDWATLSNWRIGEATPVALPGANDTVLFPTSAADGFTGWMVTLAADVYATNVVVVGDMSFSGGQIHTGNVGGSGTITLNGNAGFHTYDWENANLEVTNNLVITGTGNRFQTQGSNSYMNGGSIDVLGCVTGNGEITTVGKRSRVRLHGDWSEFTGTVNAQDDGVPRHAFRLMAAQASSSNAVYNIWMSNESAGNSAFVDTSSSSYTTDDRNHYYFGALNGRITIYQRYNNTLEIGALNQDCAFTGNIAATHRNHIKKVGTATLTFSGSGLGRLEVAGGVFSSATESAIPAENITFSGEGGFFDPTTNTVDFAARLVNSTTAPIGLLITNNVTIGQIPSSNTAGLVKKGEGTLVLGAAPQYSGDTYLDGGTLKIPASANIKVKTNVEGMSVRKTVGTGDDQGYTVYTLGKKHGTIFLIF